MLESLKDLLSQFLTRTTVVTASTLAGGALAYYAKEPIQKKWATFKARSWLQRIPATGISNFYPNRDSYQKDRGQSFLEYISSAKNSLSYCGHWLAFSIDQHNTLESLCKLAQEGKHVQLILLDPNLPAELLKTYATYFNESEDYLRNQISNTWDKVTTARKMLGEKHQTCLELRKHQEFISYSSFWFDRDHVQQHILVDVKIFGISRRDSYGIELKPTSSDSDCNASLFKRYSKSIESLVTKSQPI